MKQAEAPAELSINYSWDLEQSGSNFVYSCSLGPNTVYRIVMLVCGESIHYSSSQIENVPKLVEGGDSQLQSTLTAAHT